jgi:hypothetical protein
MIAKVGNTDWFISKVMHDIRAVFLGYLNGA